MSDDKKRIFYTQDNFSLVIGVDHVTLSSDYDGYLGIVPVGNGVMIHRRLLASIVRFLDTDIARDALALPRVLRVNRAGEPLDNVKNSEGLG